VGLSKLSLTLIAGGPKKRRAVKLTGDTRVFEEGQVGEVNTKPDAMPYFIPDPDLKSRQLGRVPRTLTSADQAAHTALGPSEHYPQSLRLSRPVWLHMHIEH